MKLKNIIKRLIVFSVMLCFFASFFNPCVSAALFTPNVTLKSTGAILYNADTESVVFKQNEQQRFNPLYLTQIMTAIVVLESGTDLSQTITAPSYVFNELSNLPTADVRRGETISINDLLYCMAVQSSCEAASVLADFVGVGSIPDFVEKMNKRAAELGCVNTKFANAHGALVSVSESYTTLEDMLLVWKHAMTLPDFKRISAASRHTVPANNIHTESRFLTAVNLLIDSTSSYYYAPVKNGKSSGNKEIGRSLCATAAENGFTYHLITFGAPMYDGNGNYINSIDNLTDAKEIFSWAFKYLQVKTLLKTGESVAEIKVSLSSGKDFVLLFPAEDFTVLMDANISVESVQKVPELPESVKAPVKKGDQIGYITLRLQDEDIARIPLVAGEDVSANSVMKSADILTSILFSPWFIGGIAAAFLLIFSLVVYRKKYGKRGAGMNGNRKYKRVRRPRRF